MSMLTKFLVDVLKVQMSWNKKCQHFVHNVVRGIELTVSLPRWNWNGSGDRSHRREEPRPDCAQGRGREVRRRRRRKLDLLRMHVGQIVIKSL